MPAILQPGRHILQRHALGFGHHQFHPDKLQNHHATEKEENPSGRKGRDHFRKKSSEERGEEPVRKTTQRLALGAKFIREYLGDEHPDDSPLTNGVGGDEGEDANRDDAVVSGKEGPGDKPQREDITKRADIKQGAAAQPINEPKPYESENKIGHADANGLQKRGIRTQTGKFKYARSKVENGVDAGELVEEGNQKSQQDGSLELAAPEAR